MAKQKRELVKEENKNILRNKVKEPSPESKTALEQIGKREVKADVVMSQAINHIAEKLKENQCHNLITTDTPEDRKDPQKKLVLKNSAALAISQLSHLITSPEEEKTSKSKEYLLLPHNKIPIERIYIEDVCVDRHLTPASINKVKHYKYSGLLKLTEAEASQERQHFLKRLHGLPVSLWKTQRSSENAFTNKIKPWVASPQFQARHNVYFIMAYTGSKRQAVKAESVKSTSKQKVKNTKAANLVLHRNTAPQVKRKTTSEVKLPDKVHTKLNLSSEPTTSAMRDEHAKSTELSVLRPVEYELFQKKSFKSLTDVATPLSKRSVTHKSAKRTSEKGISVIVKGKKTSNIPSGKSKKLMATGHEHTTHLMTKQNQQRKFDTGYPSVKKSGKTAVTKKLKKTKATLILTPRQNEKVFFSRSTAGHLPSSANKLPSLKTPLKQLQKTKTVGIVMSFSRKTSSMKENNGDNVIVAALEAPDSGLRQEPKASSSKSTKKLCKVPKSDYVIPLEKKSPEQNIFRSLADHRLPLSTRRTSREKVLFVKIKARKKYKVPPKKIKRVAGLLTSVKDQTSALSENIIGGKVEAGTPLSESKVSFENLLLNKTRTHLSMPYPKTSREKTNLQKLSTHLGGKFEKDFETGFLPLPTSSKKNENNKYVIVTKSLEKRIGTEDMHIPVKTTYERGCDCNKKKIKFKNSYIKIIVASPDISSTDCFNSGVNTKAFVNNRGIRFIVGSAIGVPLYSRAALVKELLDDIYFKYGSFTTNKAGNKILYKHINNGRLCSNSDLKVHKNVAQATSNTIFCTYKTTSDDGTHCIYTATHTSSDIINNSDIQKTSDEEEEEDPSEYLKKDIFRLSSNIYQESFPKETYSSKSMSRNKSESLILLSNSSTLSLSTSQGSWNTSSLLTTESGSSSNHSTHYFNCQLSNDLFSNPNSDSNTDDSNYSPYEVQTEESIDASDESVLCNEYLDVIPTHVYQIFRMSGNEANPLLEKKCKHKQRTRNGEPIVVINHLNSERDITTIVDELLAKNDFSDVSSIFVLVPSEDNDADGSTDFLKSCTTISENQILYRGGNINNYVDFGMNDDPYYLPKLKSPKRSTTTLTLFRAQDAPCNTPPCSNLPLQNKLPLCDTPPCSKLQSQKQLPLKSNNIPPCQNKPSCLCNGASTTCPEPPVKPCDCTAEKLKELIEQAVGTGATRHKKPLCRRECRETDTQTRKRPSRTAADTAVSTKKKGKDGDCLTCQHPPTVDECGCDDKKNPIKLKPVCPCQAYPRARPRKPIAQHCTESGPKSRPTKVPSSYLAVPPKTTTSASSSITSRLIPVRQPALTQIIGPAGESMEIEAGKIYNQAGNKQIKLISTIGTSTDHDLDYKCKTEKKTKNVTCECPEEEFEREPKPEPILSPMPEPETNQFEWVDLREIKKMKSDLTHRISGFTMHKKRQQAPTDEESSIDDAIKYYAAMYPELFQRILKQQLLEQQSPPPPSSSLATTVEKPWEKKIKVSKKPNTKVYCEWPEGVAILPLRSAEALPPCRLEETSPFSITFSSRSESTLAESQYNKGPVKCLKYKISSKGRAELQCFGDYLTMPLTRGLSKFQTGPSSAQFTGAFSPETVPVEYREGLTATRRPRFRPASAWSDNRLVAKNHTGNKRYTYAVQTNLQKTERNKISEKSSHNKILSEKENILSDKPTLKQSSSERTPPLKNFLNRTRKQPRLSTEPRSSSKNTKMYKSDAPGIVIPVIKKSELITAPRALDAPEEVMSSEEALTNNFLNNAQISSKIPLKMLRKIRRTGLIETPLEGKTPEQKEKILRCLIGHNFHLPDGKTSSEIKMIDKIRKEVGLPIQPKTQTINIYNKSIAAANTGLLQPLAGKSPKDKVNTRQGLGKLKIPSAEGRTPSTKVLETKISDKPRKTKAADLLTPIRGKTGEKKHKILWIQTASEVRFIEVHDDLNLPVEPNTNKAIRKKHDQATRTGLLSPLERKTMEEKRKQLQGSNNMGTQLPKGRPPSEKKYMSTAPIQAGHLVNSKKKRKPKSNGLFTILEGKTSAQKVKLLKGLAMHNIPLPEAKTQSQKRLIDKVRARLPPLTKALAMKERLVKATEAGLLDSLVGKTQAEKEKVLSKLTELGIPHPEDRTSSEKILIQKTKEKIKKIKLENPMSSSMEREYTKKSVETMHITKFTSKFQCGVDSKGFLTKFERSKPEVKPIFQKLSTPNIVNKLSIEDLDQNSNNDYLILSKLKKMRKAKATNLFSNLAGKTISRKAEMLKSIVENGLPLPEGKTASEKQLIRRFKIRANAHPKAKLESIEKKKERKAFGLLTSKKVMKNDQTVECDNIHIKTITPEFQIPRERTPNMRIRDTCASAIDKATHSIVTSNRVLLEDTMTRVHHSDPGSDYFGSFSKSPKSWYKETISSNSGINLRAKLSSAVIEHHQQNRSTQHFEGNNNTSERREPSSENFKSTDGAYKGPRSQSAANTLDSIVVIKSETSLSFNSSSSNSLGTACKTSDMGSSITSYSSNYSSFQSTVEVLGVTSLEELTTSFNTKLKTLPGTESKNQLNATEREGVQEFTILRISQANLQLKNDERKTNNSTEQLLNEVVMDEFPSELDVSKLMDKIMTKKRFHGVSSIFIVVPTSDDDEAQNSRRRLNSTTSFLSSASPSLSKSTNYVNKDPQRLTSNSKRVLKVCRKSKRFYMRELSSSNESQNAYQNESRGVLKYVKKTKNEIRRIATPNKKLSMLKNTKQGIAIDTTEDRPCCCQTKTADVIQTKMDIPYDPYPSNVISRPLFLKDKYSDWLRSLSKRKDSAVMSVAACQMHQFSYNEQPPSPTPCPVHGSYAWHNPQYSQNSNPQETPKPDTDTTVPTNATTAIHSTLPTNSTTPSSYTVPINPTTSIGTFTPSTSTIPINTTTTTTAPINTTIPINSTTTISSFAPFISTISINTTTPDNATIPGNPAAPINSTTTASSFAPFISTIPINTTTTNNTTAPSNATTPINSITTISSFTSFIPTIPINTTTSFNATIPDKPTTPISSFTPLISTVPIYTTAPTHATIPINSTSTVSSFTPFISTIPICTTTPDNATIPGNPAAPISSSTSLIATASITTTIPSCPTTSVNPFAPLNSPISINAAIPIKPTTPGNPFTPLNSPISSNASIPINPTTPVNPFTPLNSPISINAAIPIKPTTPTNPFTPLNSPISINTTIPINTTTPIHASIPNNPATPISSSTSLIATAPIDTTLPSCPTTPISPFTPLISTIPINTATSNTATIPISSYKPAYSTIPVITAPPTNSTTPVGSTLSINPTTSIASFAPTVSSIPISTTIPVDATTSFNTTIPNNTTVPIVTTIPITSSLPINMSIKPTMPIEPFISINRPVPIKPTIPIDTTISTSSTIPTACTIPTVPSTIS
ncbi:unnamed protein product [Spodoptera exigua]|nr:unnamed protein product [Spodoptera exigua]